MKYDVLLKKITRLCAEMISAGGSSELVPLRVNYICKKYGLEEPAFIINPTSILATAIAPDGTDLTAIRAIDGIGQNFGKLQRLNEYCNTIITSLPSAEEIDREIEKINHERYLSTVEEYIASILLGTGFAMLFGGDIKDLLVAVVSCILIVFISSLIKKTRANAFFLNAVVCLVVVSFIIFSTVSLGLCHHPESVSLGVIMLLISGLNLSEGLWSLINKETAIGQYKLINSVLGAVGIVVGIATPLMLIDYMSIQALSNKGPLIIQALLSALACGGFARLCCVRKKDLPVVALGAALSWIIYVLSSKLIESTFVCMAIATFVVTLYTIFISTRTKIDPVITRIVGILPLVPGTNLFYMLFGIVSKNSDLASQNFTKLIATCLGISFGFTLGKMFIKKKIYDE